MFQKKFKKNVQNLVLKKVHQKVLALLKVHKIVPKRVHFPQKKFSIKCFKKCSKKVFQKSVKKSALKSAQKSSCTFKSTQNSAQKSSFPQKSAQKSTLKSTFGNSESIWFYCPNVAIQNLSQEELGKWIVNLYLVNDKVLHFT